MRAPNPIFATSLIRKDTHMEKSLAGQTALVTGSTAGIGYAIAAALGKRGARVIVNGRTQARVDAALRTLREQVADGRFDGIAADVGTAQGVQAIVAKQPEVDILINNAGIFAVQPFLDSRDEDWETFYRVN